MLRIISVLLCGLILSVAPARPDPSTLDTETLRKLVSNLYREIDDLQAQLAAARKTNADLMKSLRGGPTTRPTTDLRKAVRSERFTDEVKLNDVGFIGTAEIVEVQGPNELIVKAHLPWTKERQDNHARVSARLNRASPPFSAPGQAGSTNLWTDFHLRITGMDTVGLITGRTLQLRQTMKVTGTVDWSNQTIFQLEPVK